MAFRESICTAQMAVFALSNLAFIVLIFQRRNLNQKRLARPLPVLL